MMKNLYPTLTQMPKALTLLPVLLLISACSMADYSAPKAELGASFAAPAPARANQGPFWAAFRDQTLEGLIQQGLARNLTIQQAIAAIDEAEAGLGMVRSADLPQLALAGQAVRGDTQGSGVIGEQSSIGLSTSWMLDIFGRNRANRAAALADLEAAQLSEQAARQSVAAAITNSYVDLRFYQEALAVTRKSISSRRETLKMTQDMVELGQAGRLEVLQAQQAIAQSEAALPALQIGFDQSVNRIATLIGGRSSDVLAQVSKGARQPSASGKPSVGLPADVIRARPDVKIAERRLASAAARVGVAEAAFWPSVSLSGTIMPTRISGGGNVTPWQIGPQINLPIFAGGANRANLSAAEARAVQAETQWRATLLQAVEEVENGLSLWSRGNSAVAAQRRLVAASQETVTLARETWRSGQGDFFSVLEAERNLLSAQSGLAQALRDQARAYAALSIAAGSVAP